LFSTVGVESDVLCNAQVVSNMGKHQQTQIHALEQINARLREKLRSVEYDFAVERKQNKDICAAYSRLRETNERQNEMVKEQSMLIGEAMGALVRANRVVEAFGKWYATISEDWHGFGTKQALKACVQAYNAAVDQEDANESLEV